jgi:predicted nucleic acid-binding protein
LARRISDRRDIGDRFARLSAAGRMSYWDALLVACAREAGCRVILTENMTDGANFGGVLIHNPFAPAGGLGELARRLLALG